MERTLLQIFTFFYFGEQTFIIDAPDSVQVLAHWPFHWRSAEAGSRGRTAGSGGLPLGLPAGQDGGGQNSTALSGTQPERGNNMKAMAVQGTSENIPTNYEMHTLGKNNNNEVATAITKYLPKEKMLFLDKGFYWYLIFIMI